jgi:hypothetical protein
MGASRSAAPTLGGSSGDLAGVDIVMGVPSAHRCRTIIQWLKQFMRAVAADIDK